MRGELWWSTKIEKPRIQFADSYDWCHKKYVFPIIVISGTVDACGGLFLNVNAGHAGSVGDASVYASSWLARKTGERNWLTIKETGMEKFTVEGSRMFVCTLLATRLFHSLLHS
eukprot:scpid87072/ scgid24138/ 